VVHGEHAWIAPAGQQFTEGVLHLHANPDARGTLARNGRDLVEKNFGWRSAAEAFRECCLKVMPGSAQRG
jgi:hypothetical protein